MTKPIPGLIRTVSPRGFGESGVRLVLDLEATVEEPPPVG